MSACWVRERVFVFVSPEIICNSVMEEILDDSSDKAKTPPREENIFPEDFPVIIVTLFLYSFG